MRFQNDPDPGFSREIRRQVSTLTAAGEHPYADGGMIAKALLLVLLFVAGYAVMLAGHFRFLRALASE